MAELSWHQIPIPLVSFKYSHCISPQKFIPSLVETIEHPVSNHLQSDNLI